MLSVHVLFVVEVQPVVLSVDVPYRRQQDRYRVDTDEHSQREARFVALSTIHNNRLHDIRLPSPMLNALMQAIKTPDALMN